MFDQGRDSGVKYPIQRLLCLAGIHRRSRGAARHYPDATRSVCRGCHVRMIRVADGWRVDEGPIPSLPQSPFM
jgi:hypothetical protein